MFQTGISYNSFAGKYLCEKSCNVDTSASKIMWYVENVILLNFDYYLQEENEMEERMKQIIKNEKCKNPSYFREPITIFMSTDIVTVVAEDFAKDGIGCKHIDDIRLHLSEQGIILPIVKLRDLKELKPREFIILNYDNVMYQEDIPDENEISSKYMIEKLEETFRLNYNKMSVL